MPNAITKILLFSLTLSFAACQSLSPSSATQSPPIPPGTLSPYADVTAADLRDTLAGLARAHDQKTQLALWVATPFLRPIDPPFQPFYSNMGKVQGELLKQIRTWAQAHNIDLTFHYTPDIAGSALKIMEARQEKLVRGDDKPTFEHDSLIQMYDDYEWQISQLQALLPKTKDPALKAYLEKSLDVHEKGSAELTALLKHFKYAP